MRYHAILLYFFLLVCSEVNATQQILEDITILDGQFKFYERPLSQLISENDFNELFAPPQCSAAWRGYKGTWNISGDQLYLIFLERDPCNIIADSRNWKEKQFDFEKIIPGKNFNIQNVEANWYSGEITIPLGDFRLVNGVNEQKELQYQVILYTVNKGKIQNREIKYIGEKSISNKFKNVNAASGSDASSTRPF